jgi:hypothetical protein
MQKTAVPYLDYGADLKVKETREKQNALSSLANTVVSFDRMNDMNISRSEYFKRQLETKKQEANNFANFSESTKHIANNRLVNEKVANIKNLELYKNVTEFATNETLKNTKNRIELEDGKSAYDYFKEVAKEKLSGLGEQELEGYELYLKTIGFDKVQNLFNADYELSMAQTKKEVFDAVLTIDSLDLEPEEKNLLTKDLLYNSTKSKVLSESEAKAIRRELGIKRFETELSDGVRLKIAELGYDSLEAILKDVKDIDSILNSNDPKKKELFLERYGLTSEDYEFFKEKWNTLKSDKTYDEDYIIANENEFESFLDNARTREGLSFEERSFANARYYNREAFLALKDAGNIESMVDTLMKYDIKPKDMLSKEQLKEYNMLSGSDKVNYLFRNLGINEMHDNQVTRLWIDKEFANTNALSTSGMYIASTVENGEMYMKSGATSNAKFDFINFIPEEDELRTELSNTTGMLVNLGAGDVVTKVTDELNNLIKGFVYHNSEMEDKPRIGEMDTDTLIDMYKDLDDNQKDILHDAISVAVNNFVDKYPVIDIEGRKLFSSVDEDTLNNYLTQYMNSTNSVIKVRDESGELQNRYVKDLDVTNVTVDPSGLFMVVETPLGFIENNGTNFLRLFPEGDKRKEEMYLAAIETAERKQAANAKEYVTNKELMKYYNAKEKVNVGNFLKKYTDGEQIIDVDFVEFKSRDGNYYRPRITTDNFTKILLPNHQEMSDEDFNNFLSILSAFTGGQFNNEDLGLSNKHALLSDDLISIYANGGEVGEKNLKLNDLTGKNAFEVLVSYNGKEKEITPELEAKVKRQVRDHKIALSAMTDIEYKSIIAEQNSKEKAESLQTVISSVTRDELIGGIKNIISLDKLKGIYTDVIKKHPKNNKMQDLQLGYNLLNKKYGKDIATSMFKIGYAESNLNSKSGNKLSSAKGMYQVLDRWKGSYGFANVEDIRNVSATEQMLKVSNVLLGRVKAKGLKPTTENLYIALHYPSVLGKPKNHIVYLEGSKQYSSNVGLDYNQDGKVTIEEIGSFVNKRAKSAMYKKLENKIIGG